MQMMAPSSAVSSTASACRLLTSDWTGFAALQKRDGHKERTARIDRALRRDADESPPISSSSDHLQWKADSRTCRASQELRPQPRPWEGYRMNSCHSWPFRMAVQRRTILGSATEPPCATYHRL